MLHKIEEIVIAAVFYERKREMEMWRLREWCRNKHFLDMCAMQDQTKLCHIVSIHSFCCYRSRVSLISSGRIFFASPAPSLPPAPPHKLSLFTFIPTIDCFVWDRFAFISVSSCHIYIFRLFKCSVVWILEYVYCRTFIKILALFPHKTGKYVCVCMRELPKWFQHPEFCRLCMLLYTRK